MTSSTPRPEQWEVWIAYVRFADNPSKGKARPVLAYNEDGDAYLCFKITSKIGSLAKGGTQTYPIGRRSLPCTAPAKRGAWQYRLHRDPFR